ncbi:MAG: OmpA family protein [Rhodobacteraceae bacterium]|nr:OmpA family protein [Paracoccaceae bacterium]
MIDWRAAIFAALLVFATLGRAQADDVTLTSRDGSVEITGTLLGYDGEFFRVETVYGVLTLDGSGVVCGGPGCPDLQAYVADITISGARTMGEVLFPALVEAFSLRNGYRVQRHVNSDTDFRYDLTDRATGRPAASIGFHVTSTSEGFADLIAGEADIALSMREATAEEIRLGRVAGIGDLGNPRHSRIVGLDAIVPLVARSNRLDSITLQALSQLYSGKIVNWAALGGPDAPVALHLREEASGLAQAFRRRVMLDQGTDLARGITRHASNADLTDAVAADPYSIGIAALSETGNARALSLAGACGRPATANTGTLKTEDYPLTLPLFVYTPARRLPVLAREFLDFARSSAAQPVIGRAGFVDLRLREIPVSAQGQRLANAIAGAGREVALAELQRMVQRMQGSSRLSLSFRFAKGGTVLDAQSRSNIEILAGQLERGMHDRNSLVFVGFSDGVGRAAANQRLALRRAETVRREVLRAAPTADRDRLDLQVDAFGETMPIACDDTDWGRGVNRRVEVWISRNEP